MRAFAPPVDARRTARRIAAACNPREGVRYTDKVDGTTWTRTLPSHLLAHITKSREVVGEIEECFIYPLLYRVP